VRLGRLRKSLNLTPDQMQAFRGLVQGNQAQRQAIRQDVRQKAQAVRDLMSQGNPNATDLGNAILALKQTRNRGQELKDQTMNTFKNSLTADQLKTLESLQIAPRRRPR
jgi:Spy/CpxP family protein refolding chaperone